MSSGFSNVVWQEGENYSKAGKGAELAIAQRPPASGGAALNGMALGLRGETVSYELLLEQAIPAAKIIFRFARLHWKAGMDPAQFICLIENAGVTHKLKLNFGDTKGWGTNNGGEWGLAEAEAGDLSKGPVKIFLTVDSETGDITLDGFFLVPKEFKLTAEELRELNRIKIYNYGYAGLNLAYSAVEQKAFGGFDIVVREFGQKKWSLNAALVDEQGKEVISFYKNSGLEVNGTERINIRTKEVQKLADGNYRVRVDFNEGKDRLEFPFTVIGEILDLAVGKKNEYKEFILAELLTGFKNSNKEQHGSVLADLKYAVDYLENTIVFLRDKRGAGEESERKKALSYFEKARNKTAQSFVLDLKNIIKQTEETIARIKSNISPYPYSGRFGDLRKAFYSKATGKLEPYRLFIPKTYEQREKTPVMLALRGGGGDENYYPDLDDGAVLKIMEKDGLIMISPKATSGYKGDGAKDLVQLLELVLTAYPKADRSLIFCTGVSMGGFGTYNLAVEYPGLLAGVACVSGTVSKGPDAFGKIENLKNTPCLILHGGADSVVPVAGAQRTAEKLKELGYVHELKIFPDYGHDYHGAEYMNLTLDFFEKHTKFRR